MIYEAERIEVAQASRILAAQRVVDAFGHVSRRSPGHSDRFLMSRSLAPVLVSPADVIELDLDGSVVSSPHARPFLERFIHAEIYRRRPDVTSVVHSHAPDVVPFTVVPGVQLHPICHVCGFLKETAKPFDIADHIGDASNLLISDANLGAHFANHLGLSTIGLMRAHGFTAVGATTALAVFNAVYTARNCRIDLSARLLGTPTYLSPAEASACQSTTSGQADRAWGLWLHELGDPEWDLR